MVRGAPARDALGYRFVVRAPDPLVREQLEELFAGLPATGSDGADELSLDDAAPAGLVDLMSRINIAAINAAAGNLLLHAGALARGDGGTAVVCGRSGSGKTTLTVRLAERGLGYVTDEAVCLDPQTLRVTPFRKPAALKPGAQHVFAHLRPDDAALADGTWLVPPAAFDKAPPLRRPLSPRLLVFPTYTPGAGCRVEGVTEAEAAFLLGGNSSRLRDVHGGPLPALARLARRAPAYRVVHDDMDAAARAVLALLEAA